jgi:hypothetical protein
MVSANKASQSASGSNSASSNSSMSATNSASSHNVDSASNSASSLVASLVTSKSDTSSSTAVKNSAVVKEVQGAVSLTNATATNIAVDGSTVTATNNYSVTLAGSAEQNAKALNIVNAAGGMVANGLNIAHSANMNAMPTLNQVNSISQVR